MALEGKVALITGGAKNLGAEIARELANCGANLAIHYNAPSSKDAADQLVFELKHRYPSIKVVFYQGDLTSAAAVAKLFEDTVREFGQIDIVVNTVGKVLKRPIADVTEEEYDSLFAYVFYLGLNLETLDTEFKVMQTQLQSRFLHPKRSCCPCLGWW